MSWLAFSNIGMSLGVVLGTSILSASLVNDWVILVLPPAMELFLEFVEDLNLIDLPLEGGSYTWFRGSNRPSMSRIN